MSRRVDEAVRRLAAQRFPEESDAQPSLPDRPARASRRTPVLVAAAVVAVVGTLVAINALRPGDAAATPPLLTYEQLAAPGGVTSVLADLADRAERQPPLKGIGRVLYTSRREWSLGTAHDAGGRDLGTAESESVHETWLNPDGTSRVAITLQGLGPSTTATVDKPALSAPGGADRATLKAWLLREGQSWGTGDWFIAPSGKLTSRMADPATTAAFLDVLSSRSDVTLEGTTTDRVGRHAVGVSAVVDDPAASFQHKRIYLLFDRTTGMLLDSESVTLTAAADDLGVSVRPPATIGYSAWMNSAFVADATSKP